LARGGAVVAATEAGGSSNRQAQQFDRAPSIWEQSESVNDFLIREKDKGIFHKWYDLTWQLICLVLIGFGHNLY
jgi:hypothetical protein